MGVVSTVSHLGAKANNEAGNARTIVATGTNTYTVTLASGESFLVDFGASFLTLG